MQPGWCQPVRQEFMENECEALPGVAYPGVRDNRSTLNTKTGYDDVWLGHVNTCMKVLRYHWSRISDCHCNRFTAAMVTVTMTTTTTTTAAVSMSVYHQC